MNNKVQKQKVHRLDFNCLYQTKKYEEAVNYANQYIGISGVRECLEKVQNCFKEYQEQMVRLHDEEAQKENSKYTLWERVHKGEIIGICAVIASIIISIGINPGSSYILTGIELLAMVVSCVGIVSAFVLKVMEMISRKMYQSYIEELWRKAAEINAKYAYIFDRLYNEIDGLYLGSLDPVLREMVLMRRDNERCHQENICLQQNFMRVQNDMLREQEKSKQLQEQLLAIEQAREERYNKRI